LLLINAGLLFDKKGRVFLVFASIIIAVSCHKCSFHCYCNKILINNNNNNNNTHDNVYSAVIMTTRSLREFTRFIW